MKIDKTNNEGCCPCIFGFTYIPWFWDLFPYIISRIGYTRFKFVPNFLNHCLASSVVSGLPITNLYHPTALILISLKHESWVYPYSTLYFLQLRDLVMNWFYLLPTYIVLLSWHHWIMRVGFTHTLLFIFATSSSSV